MSLLVALQTRDSLSGTNENAFKSQDLLEAFKLNK